MWNVKRCEKGSAEKYLAPPSKGPAALSIWSKFVFPPAHLVLHCLINANGSLLPVKGIRQCHSTRNRSNSSALLEAEAKLHVPRLTMGLSLSTPRFSSLIMLPTASQSARHERHVSHFCNQSWMVTDSCQFNTTLGLGCLIEIGMNKVVLVIRKTKNMHAILPW